MRSLAACPGPERDWRTFLERVSLLLPATRDSAARLATDLVAPGANLDREFDVIEKGASRPCFDRPGAQEAALELLGR